MDGMDGRMEGCMEGRMDGKEKKPLAVWMASTWVKSGMVKKTYRL